MSRDSRSELFILPAQHERSVIFNGSVDSSVGENGSKVEEAEGRKKLTQLIVQLQLAISAERSRQNISSLRALMQSEGIDASVNSRQLPSPTRVGRLMRRIAILATALSFLGNVGVANAENVKNEPRGKNVAPPNSGDAYSDQFPSSFPYPIEPRSAEDTPSQPYYANNGNISLANPEANHSNGNRGDGSGEKGGGARNIRKDGTNNHQEGGPSTEVSGVLTSRGIHLAPENPDLAILLAKLDGKELDTPFAPGGEVERMMQALGDIFIQHPELANAEFNISMNVVGDKETGLDVMADLVQGAEAGGFPAGTIWTKIGNEGRFVALTGVNEQISRVRVSTRLQESFAQFVTPDGKPILLSEGVWLYVMFDKNGNAQAFLILDENEKLKIQFLSDLKLNPSVQGKSPEAAIEATKVALNDVNAKPVPETAWGAAGVTREVYEKVEKYVISITPEEIRNDPNWSFNFKTRAFVNKDGVRFRSGLGQSTTNKHEAELKAGQVIEISRETFTTSDGKKSFTLVLEANKQSPYVGYGFIFTDEEKRLFADFIFNNERYKNIDGMTVFLPIADKPIDSLPPDARGEFGFSSVEMGLQWNFATFQTPDNGVAVYGINANTPPSQIKSAERIAEAKGAFLFSAVLTVIRVINDPNSFENDRKSDFELSKTASEILPFRKSLPNPRDGQANWPISPHPQGSK